VNVNAAQKMSNFFQAMQQIKSTSSTRNEARLESIKNTLKLGKKLSTADMEYLKKHDPNLHSQVMTISMERKAYESALRQSRSKEAVNNYSMNHLMAIAGQLKGSTSEEQLMRANAIQEAHLEFIRSSQYAALKSDKKASLK